MHWGLPTLSVCVLRNFRFRAGLDGGFHGPMDLDGSCTSVPDVHYVSCYNRLANSFAFRLRCFLNLVVLNVIVCFFYNKQMLNLCFNCVFIRLNFCRHL
jgi:hypothetical protein